MARITLTNGIIEVKESAIDLIKYFRNTDLIEVTTIERHYDELAGKLESYKHKLWINKVHAVTISD